MLTLASPFARLSSHFSFHYLFLLCVVVTTTIGHDTLYPSLNQVNARLGTPNDLRRLFEYARKADSLISYHINVDEAYWNFSEPGHDGQHNPECDPAILCLTPNGSLWQWGSADTRSDPLLGPSFHISKVMLAFIVLEEEEEGEEMKKKEKEEKEEKGKKKMIMMMMMMMIMMKKKKKK